MEMRQKRQPNFELHIRQCPQADLKCWNSDSEQNFAPVRESQQQYTILHLPNPN